MDYSFLYLKKLTPDDLGGVLASLNNSPESNAAIIGALYSLYRYAASNKSVYANLAAILTRQGMIDAALEAWNSAVRSRPHQNGWLKSALLFLLANRNASKFNEFFKSWTGLLEQTYLLTPDLDFLMMLAKNGWHGHGCLGIHDNRLRGWLFAAKGEQLQFSQLPGSAPIELALVPKGASATHELYELNTTLPDNFFGLTVKLGNGTHINGSPLSSFPANLETRKISKKNAPELTIIVPVYDDRAATLSCLGSIFSSLKKNKTRTCILAVWDHGPDQALYADLQRLANKGKITLLTTPANLGFLGAVNLALSQIPYGNVLLLNSDTLVSGDWLDRMNAHATLPEAATITAMGNEAELVSFPSWERRAEVRIKRHASILDNAARTLKGADSWCEIPVGVGFCMLITRKALDSIGGFDGRMICRGYSEETDFCLRAAKNGLKNYCALNVFVAHLGGRSFGSAKPALAAQNNAAIFQHFPDYEKEYDNFLAEKKLAPACEYISKKAAPCLSLPSMLNILPWSFQYLPEWQADINLAALFILPLGKGYYRLKLRIHADFPLADMSFYLPSSLDELRALINDCGFTTFISPCSTAPILEVCRLLGIEIEFKSDKNSLFPAPDNLEPANYILTPPSTMLELKIARDLARENPASRFYIPWLAEIWKDVPLPSNMDWLPDLPDLRPLEPAAFIFTSPFFSAISWKDWLARKHIINLRCYTLGEN